MQGKISLNKNRPRNSIHDRIGRQWFQTAIINIFNIFKRTGESRSIRREIENTKKVNIPETQNILDGINTRLTTVGKKELEDAEKETIKNEI